jgi:MoxR-like ATPase
MRHRTAPAASISWLKRKSLSEQGIASPEILSERLAHELYLPGEELSTAVFLSIKLGKPLLLEGMPGVGKTEAAKALASALGLDLIRLQCYEGIDAGHALYEWNYARQLLSLRRDHDADLYSDEFLIERPLLKALKDPAGTLLLIDEIDRADHEFEAFLLEFLSEFQISIPERGTLKAVSPPFVILTSNRTRELHEALRRRCIYNWIAYPDPEREERIIMLRAPDVAREAAKAVVAAVNGLRRLPLAKTPGISEAIDWANAASLLEKSVGRWPEAFRRSIGVAIKDEQDLALVKGELDTLLAKACAS